MYKMETVTHKILRTIKGVIEIKHIFVFTLLAIKELIFKRYKEEAFSM